MEEAVEPGRRRIRGVGVDTADEVVAAAVGLPWAGQDRTPQRAQAQLGLIVYTMLVPEDQEGVVIESVSDSAAVGPGDGLGEIDPIDGGAD